MSEPTTTESSSFNQPSGYSVFEEMTEDLDDYQFCPIKKENVEEEEEYLEVIEQESCQDDNDLAVEGTEEIPEMINLTGRGQTKILGRQFFDDITDLVLKHPNEFRGTRYSFAKVAEELATKYGVEAGPDFRTRVAATWNNHRRYLMVLENKGRELTKREQWILNFKKGCNMEINESEPQVQAHQNTRHSRKKIKKTTALMEAVASCSHLKKSNKPGGNSVFWTLVEQRFLERLPDCSRKGLRPKLQQILSGVTVRARKKVASGRKLKSDEKLALKVNGNGNCNSPENSTANDQEDLSHARRSRRSSTTVQDTSVTSLNYSDAFKFIVCNAVAKHPELFEAQRTRNFKLGKEIWKRIEKEIREVHPGPGNLSAICQAWQRCKEHAFSHKKSGKMREIDKLVFDILSKNSPESLSRRLDTINRSVGQQDSNFLESLSTEMDTTVASGRSENSSGRPRRSCRSSVANYKDPVLELSSEDDEINANSAAPSAAVSRRSVTRNSQRIELASAEAVEPTSSVIREGGGSNAPRNDDTSANNALQTPMPLTEKEPSPIRNLNSSTTSETAPISGSSTTENVLREEGANREDKSLSLQEWLKVAEFCKRTKHAFRLDGNELVLTDREAPENEFRLPIDRVMSQLA